MRQASDHKQQYRALSLIELFDATFTTYRQSFRALIGNIAVFVLIGAVAIYSTSRDLLLFNLEYISPLSFDFRSMLFAGVAGSPNQLFVQVGMLIASLVVFSDAGIVVSAKSFLGQNAEALVASKRVSFFHMVPLVLLILPFVVIVQSVGNLLMYLSYLVASGEWQTLLFVEPLTVINMSGLMPLLVALFILAGVSPFLLSLPIVVLEGLPFWQALRRSWELMRGAFWPAITLMLLISAIQALLSQALRIVTVVGATFWNMNFGLLWYQASMIVATGIEILCFPLLPVGMMLLYYSQRIRHEGYEIEIAMADDFRQRMAALNEQLHTSLKAGRLEDTYSVVEEILQLDPDDYSARAQRFHQRLDRIDLQGALADAEYLVSHYQQTAHAFGYRALVRARLGDQAGSASDCTQALKLQPSLAGEVEHHALSLYHADRLPAALRYFTLLCMLQPKLAVAHYNQACTLARLGRAEEALTALQQTVTLEPQQAAEAHNDPDFASLRGDPRFVALTSSTAP